MTDLIQFSQDVLDCYWKLGLGSKFLLGGFVITASILTYGKKLGILVLKILKPLRKKPAPVAYKAGVVYLHSFPRRMTLHTPNLSPYAVKLETWLRLKKIQYEFVETVQMSKSTRQIPYIMLDDKEHCDSSMIMEFLCKEKGVDGMDNLNTEQQATARALAVMMDESFAWTSFMYRYVYVYKDFLRTTLRFTAPLPIRNILEKSFPKMFLERAVQHGVGRKPQDMVTHIGCQDLQAISDFLGDKQFMMGAEITAVDCSVFGQLCQVVDASFAFPLKDYIEENCQNLLPYMERIKARLWPDWNRLVKVSHD